MKLIIKKKIIKDTNDTGVIHCKELGTNEIKIDYSASNLNETLLVYFGWDAYIKDANDNTTKINVKNIIINNKGYIIVEYKEEA